jgi:hypothetical protein
MIYLENSYLICNFSKNRKGVIDMSYSHKEIPFVYLKVIKARFEEMKSIAEKTFEQLNEESLFWKPHDNSNSIAVIMKHMSGHMVSRWTNVLISDGEKPFRDRDGEFEHSIFTREELYEMWNKGWNVFINELDSLKEEDLLREIFISNKSLTVIEAIEKSMYHYSYHIGQIVYIGKQLKSIDWKSLTIPKKIK